MLSYGKSQQKNIKPEEASSTPSQITYLNGQAMASNYLQDSNFKKVGRKKKTKQENTTC